MLLACVCCWVYPKGMGEPGWHQDPWGSGGQRYWDGTAWTGHYSPPQLYLQQPQTAVVAVGTNHAVHAILTLLSCGAWLPIWILIAIFESRRINVQR